MMNGENNVVEKWVNLDDIANHLSVSKDTIRAWIKAKMDSLRRKKSCILEKCRRKQRWQSKCFGYLPA